MLNACCYAADINECWTHPCGVGKLSCDNSDGSYSCTCKDGYEAKNGTCIGLSTHTVTKKRASPRVYMHVYTVMYLLFSTYTVSKKHLMYSSKL